MVRAVVRMRSIARAFPFVAGLCFCAVGAGTAVSSCGSNADHGMAPERDAGDAGADVSAAKADSGGCQPASDAAEPQLVAQVDFDGGVPLDQVPFAEAVARCTYLSRCSPMAAYELNECVAAFTQGDAWTYVECGSTSAPNGTTTTCMTETLSGAGGSGAYPNALLLQYVDAGLVRYDPDAEAACVRALQAQPCHGNDLWYDIPACVGSFSCAPDAGSRGAGSGDSGVADGGPSCASFVTGANPLRVCATNGDCAGDAGPSADPYCVDGYCYSASCGAFFGCPSFVGSGEPCDSDPPRLGNFVGPGNRPCAAGLTCRGASTDGGPGTCATPQDVGGSCSEGAGIAGCALGLTCQCGTCRIPPSRGACASGACEVGVAYCDIKSDTCVPVQPIGGDCTAGPQACAPSTTCDTATNTCEPPMP